MSMAQFEEAFNDGLLDDLYAEYIYNNSAGDRIIGNGDMLIEAMEEGYLYDSFMSHILNGGF